LWNPSLELWKNACFEFKPGDRWFIGFRSADCSNHQGKISNRQCEIGMEMISPMHVQSLNRSHFARCNLIEAVPRKALLFFASFCSGSILSPGPELVDGGCSWEG
jgi:hypothetical protein